MRKSLPPLSILIFLIVLSIGYAAINHYSTDGYVLANVIKINDNILTIGTDCRAIVGDTSPERALSIQRGINNEIIGRPMTHDTFMEVLKSFNITIEAVKIQYHDDQYYYADMILSDNNKVLTIDLMPSDGIALAVRAGAPIYINQTLLDEAGEDIC